MSEQPTVEAMQAWFEEHTVWHLTAHAGERMIERSISIDQVIDALARGERKPHPHGTAHYSHRGVTVVVNEKCRTIITVTPTAGRFVKRPRYKKARKL